MNFEEAFNKAPVGVVISFEKDQKIVFANRVFQAISQRSLKELVGKTMDDIIFPGAAVDFLLRKDNESVPVEKKVCRYSDGEGNNIYLIHYISILENKTGIAGGAFLNALLENYSDVIYFKDKESRFLKVNKAFLNRYKIQSYADIYGKTDFDLFADSHARAAFEDEKEILITGQPLLNKEEEEVGLQSGDIAWVSTSKMPFYDENKNLIGTFGVSKDITHLKQAEFQVKENLNILKGITDNIPVIIFEYNKKKRQFDFIGKKEIVDIFKKSKAARLRIEDHLDYILDITFGNKEKHGFLTFSSSFSDKKSERYFDNYVFESVTGSLSYVGISIEVTDRKVGQRNIKKYAKSLESINKELNDFAYIISHDLKAPLRAISNLSEWIEEDISDSDKAEVKENLRLLRKRVLRMENLINGILNYSRASRDTTIEENIDVANLVKEAIDLLAVPKKFKVKINARFPVIDFNRSNIDRIFMNLISNAVNHHDKPVGKITLDYRDEEKFHEFSVEDDGPGIAKEYHDKIFVIFQTLRARDSFESTGIGLTIVKKIIEDCGGIIWVESEPGIGSKFIFRIPKQAG